MDKPVILVADDEPANLTVFTQLLGEHYQVRACKSGEQVMRLVNAEPRPDLILLDVMMPGTDGYGVLAKLREDSRLREIPVIFVTSLDDALDEEIGLRLGAVDYIAKPIRPAILLARVKAHLEIKRARDQLKHQNIWLEAEVSRRTQEGVLIQNVSLSIILGLAETRDSDTGNHISRTQAYVEVLSNQLRRNPQFAAALSEVDVERMIKASPLHDIGKVGIPDSILLKPGKLTVEEWATMQSHTLLGANAIRLAIDKALRASPSDGSGATSDALAVLEVARVIAAGHHERWDGTGYPERLREDAIPIPARIMAVADVYDALTTPRVYKAPWTTDQAAAYIIEQRGLQFDPAVVDAFQMVQAEFAAICRRLSDAPVAVGEGVQR